MARMFYGSSLVLVLVLSAATLSPSRPEARSILVLPATPYHYANVTLPAHFTQAGRNHDNTPPDNAVSDDGATLGRVLFYDTRLSANDTTSCASCHVQSARVCRPEALQQGISWRSDGPPCDAARERPLLRALTVLLGRTGRRPRGDGAAAYPESDRNGTGSEAGRRHAHARPDVSGALRARLWRSPDYGTANRQSARTVRSIHRVLPVQVRRGAGPRTSAQDGFGNFTLQENRGKALFMRNCSTCHRTDGNEHFFGQVPANTGLRGNDPRADGGVGDVTLRVADFGSFKSPSLRNVEVTAPYGHDGRFATLDALIDHYSDNPISDPNLGYVIPRPLKFTASEKAALIAFLKTLTDRTCLADARFSNPFVEKDDARKRASAPWTAGAMLMTIGAAAAEATVVLRSAVTVPEPPPLPFPPLPKSSHPLIERLVSFDGNADRRISRHELPERMQTLVARGDANADAALDSNEIRYLVYAGSPKGPGVRPSPSAIRGLARGCQRLDASVAKASSGAGYRHRPHVVSSIQRPDRENPLRKDERIARR